MKLRHLGYFLLFILACAICVWALLPVQASP
jgi:hypothetical protein